MAKRQKWIDPLTKAERAEYVALKQEGRYDGRICLSIMFFTEEAKADRFGELSKKEGNTYNGGYFHGMECGREKERDYTDADGVRWYGATL
jgi:hypothetical protein